MTIHYGLRTVICNQFSAENTVEICPLLPGSGQKVKIRLKFRAFHSAFSELLTSGKNRTNFDGFICLYSTKRRASFEHLKTLIRLAFSPGKNAEKLQNRALLMAVGEVTDFFSDKRTNQLLSEGNDLADKLKCRFSTASPDREQLGNFKFLFKRVAIFFLN